MLLILMKGLKACKIFVQQAITLHCDWCTIYLNRKVLISHLSCGIPLLHDLDPKPV